MTAEPIRDRIEAAQPLRAVEQPALRYEPTPFVWYDPATLPKRQWIYGWELQRKTLSSIIGPGAAGKTKYKAARAVAMTSGKPLLGTTVHDGPKTVWLWNHEDHLEELHRDIFAVMQHWRLSAEDVGLGTRLFIDSAMDGIGVKIGRMDPVRGALINQDVCDALTEALIRKKIDYFDLDPFVKIHGVEENSNEAIAEVAYALAKIATTANVALGAAHHIAKARADQVNVHSSRGAVSFTDACRSVLAINKMSEEEAKSFGVVNGDRRRYFKMLDDKNNRAPPAANSDWYRFESVELPNGDHQGIVVSWEPPDIFEGLNAGHIFEVQELVAKHSAEPGGVRASDLAKTRWVGNLIAKVVKLDVAKPEDKARIKRILKTWMAHGRFVEVKKKDANGDERPFIEVGQMVDPSSYSARADGGVAER